jgi:hypothetical protein
MWALAGFVQAVSFFGMAAFIAVAWFREPPINPEVEERALMRQMSWPTDTADAD